MFSWMMCGPRHLIDVHLNPIFSLYFQIKENDKVVLETILSIFNPMLEVLPEQDDSNRCCFVLKPILCWSIHQHHLPTLVHLIPCREGASWDVKLSLDYKDLQRKIISSIITSCTSALEIFWLLLDGIMDGSASLIELQEHTRTGALLECLCWRVDCEAVAHGLSAPTAICDHLY